MRRWLVLASGVALVIPVLVLAALPRPGPWATVVPALVKVYSRYEFTPIPSSGPGASSLAASRGSIPGRALRLLASRPASLR